MDCESTQHAVHNPVPGERAIRGLGEVFGETRTKDRFLVMPGDIEKLDIFPVLGDGLDSERTDRHRQLDRRLSIAQRLLPGDATMTAPAQAG